MECSCGSLPSAVPVGKLDHESLGVVQRGMTFLHEVRIIN